MSDLKPILLLTASIDPKVSNTPMTFITKPELRLSQYRQTLLQMINSKCFGKIVFCENTDYAEDFLEEKALAESKGIQFEYLRFHGSYDKIHELGKGYGEGEIIAHAIENSKLMADTEHFYKLTGRIQLKNIDHLLLGAEMKQLFIKNKANENSVDTRFFACTKEFYKEHLLETYKEVNDLEGNYLELVFYKALKPLSEQISVFSAYPKFMGFAGSTGQSYTMGTLKYWWYQYQLKRGNLSI